MSEKCFYQQKMENDIKMPWAGDVAKCELAPDCKCYLVKGPFGLILKRGDCLEEQTQPKSEPPPPASPTA